MFTNKSFDAETPEDASSQQVVSSAQEPLFIDRIPIELLERLISLGAKNDHDGLLEVKRVRMWRSVSRKWKNVIDNCPSLWSSIRPNKGIKHVRTQLEKSKGARIDIVIGKPKFYPLDDDWIPLLVENAHRWRSIAFSGYDDFSKLVAQLGPSPLMMDSISIKLAIIPLDCKLFDLVRPNLRKLELATVIIPDSLDATLGLEELRLSGIKERMEDGTQRKSPNSKFRRFLQVNPNLRRLELSQECSANPNDRDLQPVDLPKLEEVAIYGSQLLQLVRAEHCRAVRYIANWITENPPLSAWTTLAHTLRRVKRLKIIVSDASLWVGDVGGPDQVEVRIQVSAVSDEERHNLLFSLLKDILDEAEKGAQISAHVELGLFATREWGSDLDLNLRVLELLQTPVPHSSSRQTRWRTPNLDTIRLLEPGLMEPDLPYHDLRAFIQARSNGDGIQPASPITGIFIQSDKDNDENFKEVLDEVLSCSGEWSAGPWAVY
ncbi:hypothetical protein FRC01_013571 [Tulasnella sp. 417]|nr:hypothetical protein FRC01_013571 [Tulasnella sp. 417]